MTWRYISEGCSLNAMLLYLPECKMTPSVVKYVELPWIQVWIIQMDHL